MKTGVIIQARMSSTRLPGKIARELPYGSGITMLEQVVRRIKKCRLADEVIVATTTDRDDDAVVRLAKKAGAEVFRGSKEDVLSRCYFAAKENKLDTIVRITSDCPCIDPFVADQVIKTLISSGADYVSNTLARTFPHGLDAEAFTFKALERAHENAKDGPEREHVTFYIYRRPGEFKLRNIKAPPALRRPDIRITVDTPEDYVLACVLYDFLYSSDKCFGLRALVRIFKKKPWLSLINGKVRQKKVFRSFSEELPEAVRVLELQDLRRAAAELARQIKK